MRLSFLILFLWVSKLIFQIPGYLILNFIELLLFFSVVLMTFKNNKINKSSSLFILFTIFIIFYAVNSININIPFKVILIQIKWFVYLFVLNKLYIKFPFKIRYKKLLYTYLFIYLFERIILSIERPEWLIENNFEIVLFAFFLIQITNLKLLKNNLFVWVTFFLILLLSNSKSGIFIGSFLFCYSLINTFRNYKILYFVIFSVIIFGTVRSYILPNLDNLLMIDRIVFTQEFINDINSRNIYDIIFPNMQVEPINLSSSSPLYFYEDLFINDVAYSSLYHIMNYRLIFNFGVFGLILIYLSINCSLQKLYSKKKGRVLLFFLFLNGLSVSGINNTYWFFIIVLILNELNLKKLKEVYVIK